MTGIEKIIEAAHDEGVRIQSAKDNGKIIVDLGTIAYMFKLIELLAKKVKVLEQT